MAEVATAWVSLVPEAKGFGRNTERQLGGEMSSSGSKLGKTFGTALKVGGAAVIGGGFLAAGLLKSAFGEAQEALKIGEQTKAVIKSTGGAANVSAGQVGKLAEALSLKTGIDDETIQSGQNMLLTFKNIRNEAGKGNDIFTQSTKTLVDLSTAMGTEPKQAAIQLGKALNDPVKGITALSRVGVTFTESQKKTIEQMVKTGDTAKAQKIILGELNSEFGGSAQAQATAADKMSVAWGNLKEKLGTALMPVFNRFFGFITDTVIPGAERLGGILSSKLGPSLSQVGDNASGFLPTIRDLGHWVMDKLVPAFQKLGRDVLPLLPGYMQSAKKAFNDAKPFFSLVGNIITNVLIPGISKLAQVAIPAMARHLRTLGIVLGAIGKAGKWLWNEVFQPVFSFIVKGVGKVLEYFGKMLQLIGNVPGMGWVGDLGDKLVGAAEKANNLGNSIKDIPENKTVNLNVNENWVTTRTVRKGGMGPVPGLASGGIVSRPTLALVGEGRESEAVLPLSRLNAMLNERAAAGASSGGRAVFNIIDRDGVLIGTMEGVADDRIHGHGQLAGETARAM